MATLESKIESKEEIPERMLCEALGRVAAVLCRSQGDHANLAHQLVGIPFRIFTKRSINLGILLWLGVINANPSMETRLLVEVAEHWQNTVRQRMGIFDHRLQ